MWKWIKVYCLVMLFTAVIVPDAFSQSNINFTTITVKEGLPSNTVNAIIKDKKGFMWFGTTNGLCKFDGINLVTYRNIPGNNRSLPSNEVLTLSEDREGRIWIGTGGGGLCYYDQEQDFFLKYKGDGSWKQMSNIAARAILEDHDGELWVGTYGDLRKFNLKNGHITRPPLPYLPKSELGRFVVLSLFEDSRKQMWIGTNMGLYLYDSATGSLQKFDHNDLDPQSLSDNRIKTITQDKQGNIWIGTIDGFDKWLGDGKFLAYKHKANDPNSISNNAVYAVSITDSNTFWIGTENGINVFKPAEGKFQHLLPDERNVFSLKSRYIRSLFIDPKGIYWAGTYGGGVSKYNVHLPLFNLQRSNAFDGAGLKSPFVTSFAEYKNSEVFVGTDGGGIQIFNKKTRLFKPFPIFIKLDKTIDLTVNALHLDHQGSLWAGTAHHGLFKINPETHAVKQYLSDNTPNNPVYNSITSFAEDLKGRLWIGTSGRGISIYDPKTQLFSTLNRTLAPGFRQTLPLNDYINSLTTQANGDIWIGSSGTGVAVYNADSETISLYNKANSKLSDDVVVDLLVARDGTLWAGTNQGISYFDPGTKMFNSFGERDGLANGSVKDILQDETGLIWLSTDRGISSFDRFTKTFRNFTDENGVQSSSFLNTAGLKTRDGDLFFGGQDGFNFFNPKMLPVEQKPERITFNQLKIDNADVQSGADAPIKVQINLAQQIRLRYGQNFSIGYVTTDFTSPKQDLYAYKLKGFDKGWNYVGKIRVANYTNLDPGTYTFEVMVSRNNYQWNGNKISRIKIIVLPPFYRTIYAYILYITLVVLILLLVRRRGIQKLRRQFESAQEKQVAKQFLEQERREAERMHELDQSKIKFLTDLSHEFRTPISLVLAPLEKLIDNPVTSNNAVHLKAMHRNVKRLLNLVNQLLDFRKMEEQELKLSPAPGDAVGFLIDAATSFEDVADRKQISFNVSSQEEKWQTNFDHDKLEKVLFNLLSNAFKFTPKGGSINLKIEKRPVDETTASLIITISDSGVGIAEKDLSKIFDRFYQAVQNKTILNQGTGIGLAIAREFVELHGGNISARSTPDIGSVFIVTLPLPETRSQEILLQHHKSVNELADIDEIVEISANQPHKTALQTTTILLVEDNDEFRYYLADHLKQYYNIIEACNGKEGWQKALNAHPQLIVSDISMPEMNGIALSNKLKTDKRTSHIPIILLTAITGEEDQLKGLRTGASDYLTKPFNFQILHAKINNLLVLNKTLKATYTKQITVQGIEVPCESSDVKLLNTIMKCVEDHLSGPDLTVEELSRQVGMSRGSLYYKLLEITGYSPVEYIRTIRLEKAKTLLEASDFNIAQVAYMTGFGTPSYFSRQFKKKYGVLPSDYLVEQKMQRSKPHILDAPD